MWDSKIQSYPNYPHPPTPPPEKRKGQRLKNPNSAKMRGLDAMQYNPTQSNALRCSLESWGNCSMQFNVWAANAV